MLNSIHFINAAGDVIVELFFSRKFPRNSIQSYWNTCIKGTRYGEAPPSLALHHGVLFCHLVINHVYIVGTTTEDDSALLLFDNLHLLTRLITSYLVDISESTLRENFSLVCQIIQEAIDFGYPLSSQLFELEELVPRPTMESKLKSIVDMVPGGVGGGGGQSSTSSPAGLLTHASAGTRRVPWRSELTRHSTNEILFDVVEYLDVIVEGNGKIAKSFVRGEIEVNCRLSGMPEVVMRLSNTSVMDHVGFHRCVQTNRYDTDGTLTFTPPDGKFVLMQYYCHPSTRVMLDLPFYVAPQVAADHTGGRFTCMAGMKGGRYGSAEADEVHNVSVRLTLPPHTSSVEIDSCSAGSAVFLRDRGVLLWSIGKIGKFSPTVSGTFTLASVPQETKKVGKNAEDGEEEKENDDNEAEKAHKDKNSKKKVVKGNYGVAKCSAATVDFVVPNHSSSGFTIDSVQLLGCETLKPYKGVKHMTKAGTYVIRVS